MEEVGTVYLFYPGKDCESGLEGVKSVWLPSNRDEAEFGRNLDVDWEACTQIGEKEESPGWVSGRHLERSDCSRWMGTLSFVMLPTFVAGQCARALSCIASFTTTHLLSCL